MYTVNSFNKEEIKEIEKGIEKCLSEFDIRAFLSNTHGIDYETEEYNNLENYRGCYDLMFDYNTGKLFKQEIGWGKSYEMNTMICLRSNIDYIWEDEIEDALNSLLED